MAFDQVKMLQQLRKAQKQLGKEIIEVEAGDGAVVVQITGELKIKSIKINPKMVDLDNIEQLEHWIQIAIRDGLAKAQEVAAETMKPLMGGLGNLPF
ncbi:YbaB/EbfC family nucleoid-associated protein [Candidatus Saccharibacteria bacterium oral taxon 488]|jgi:DNA-binding protein, ybaB/ebfC family|nr:YbaB/EbfC family nucleoid-associated protein [Candidatus Saccharibacteria bacterium]QHU93779.1 YbaB/EbfC family nucleoid-associated protein [Candidatus Saccharibacteria bacterium oral taxon 488]QJU04992.1 YbaB/EbfC family nucleoid-associated protein [Candidatus Saccharibacteria bacterium oral taxon 488]QJU07471.1 YbaB/EbfC family nucleoid-associated protein [Candidatus Saccharibacteria bacterium oral taxon 488]QJU10063.1 YbaB/EbfC family nucleoid-associated protein [Candidatus Saccharibacter